MTDHPHRVGSPVMENFMSVPLPDQIEISWQLLISAAGQLLPKTVSSQYFHTVRIWR
jgi:hypothetical protein